MVYGYFLWFSKKLLVLLYLEGVIICLIVHRLQHNISYFKALILSIFIVLDRVLGVTLFIGSARSGDCIFDVF